MEFAAMEFASVNQDMKDRRVPRCNIEPVQTTVTPTASVDTMELASALPDGKVLDVGSRRVPLTASTTVFA
jgi:hypothetical protein